MKPIQAKFKHSYSDQTSLPCFHQPWTESPELNQTPIWLFIQIINNLLRKTEPKIHIHICWILKNLKEIILSFNVISIQ